jgi:hypothetical protein
VNYVDHQWSAIKLQEKNLEAALPKGFREDERWMRECKRRFDRIMNDG